jgi:hypothetical protein
MSMPQSADSRSVNGTRRVVLVALALLGVAVHAPGRAAEPPVAGSATAPQAPAAAPAPLDLPTLEERLRGTGAIGIFTKLSIKNQVDDLIAQFRAFHAGRPRPTLAQLRERFELLVLKVVTLLQDDDPELAAAVSASREAIWAVLSDPKKFADV